MERKSIWNRFGFTQNPYQKEPLTATEDSLVLFTHRPKAASEFLVQVDEKDHCVVVVSGDVGVGKTTFVNIHQHMLATGKAPHGPKLLPCLYSTSPNKADTPLSLVQRLVQNTVRNIELYCSKPKKPIPKETDIVRTWLSHKPSASGYQITVGPVGFGREFNLPPLGDATFETWHSVLEAIAQEAELLGVDGLVVCLDNVETLYRGQPNIDELAKLLMAFRDTLFVTKGVWWIIIGESGLYNLIDENDHRISQRIRGNGVEIPPFVASEFHDLIDKRIKTYAKSVAAKSPLTQEVHSILFEASCGAVRFALDTADLLLTKIVAEIRADATKALGSFAAPNKVEQLIDDALKNSLKNDQIPTERAINELKEITLASVQGLKLSKQLITAIKTLKNGTVTSSEFLRFGFNSEEKFVVGFLEYLHERNALARREVGDRITYRLKGFVKLCHEFGLLSKLTQK